MGPKIAKMLQSDFKAQKLSKCCNFWAQKLQESCNFSAQKLQLCCNMSSRNCGHAWEILYQFLSHIAYSIFNSKSQMKHVTIDKFFYITEHIESNKCQIYSLCQLVLIQPVLIQLITSLPGMLQILLVALKERIKKGISPCEFFQCKKVDIL